MSENNEKVVKEKKAVYSVEGTVKCHHGNYVFETGSENTDSVTADRKLGSSLPGGIDEVLAVFNEGATNIGDRLRITVEILERA